MLDIYHMGVYNTGRGYIEPYRVNNAVNYTRKRRKYEISKKRK